MGRRSEITLFVVRVLFVIYMAQYYFIAGFLAYEFIPDDHAPVFGSGCVACLYVQAALMMFVGVFVLFEIILSVIFSHWFVNNKAAVYGIHVILFSLNHAYVYVLGMYIPTFDEYMNVMMQAILVAVSVTGLAEQRMSWAKSRCRRRDNRKIGSKSNGF